MGGAEEAAAPAHRALWQVAILSYWKMELLGLWHPGPPVGLETQLEGDKQAMEKERCNPQESCFVLCRNSEASVRRKMFKIPQQPTTPHSFNRVHHLLSLSSFTWEQIFHTST